MWLDKRQPGSPGPSPFAQTGAPSPAAILLTAPGFPAPLTALLLSPDLCLPGESGLSCLLGLLQALGGRHWSPASSWQGASSTAVRLPMSVRSPSGDARPARPVASPSACGWACSKKVSAGQEPWQGLGELGAWGWRGQSLRHSGGMGWAGGLCRASHPQPLGHSPVPQFKGYVWTVSGVGDRSTSGGQRWIHCPSRDPSLPDPWQ